MWVAWYHVFHCSGTVCLLQDRVATQLPAPVLLLRDITADADADVDTDADITCSSVTCAIIFTLISCLLCHNL
jgi:hypothetical protein